MLHGVHTRRSGGGLKSLVRDTSTDLWGQHRRSLRQRSRNGSARRLTVKSTVPDAQVGGWWYGGRTDGGVRSENGGCSQSGGQAGKRDASERRTRTIYDDEFHIIYLESNRLEWTHLSCSECTHQCNNRPQAKGSRPEGNG